MARLRHWCSSRYLRISPLHREFRHPLRHSSHVVSGRTSWVKPRDFHTRHRLAAYTVTRFTPVIPSEETTLAPSVLHAAAGTELAGASCLRYRQEPGLLSRTSFVPSEKSFTTRGPSSLTRRCCVRLSPIAQDSPLLPPMRGVWTVSPVPVWLIVTLRPATRRRLGGPLPRQPHSMMGRGLISR